MLEMREAGDFSAAACAQYQRRWMAAYGHDFSWVCTGRCSADHRCKAEGTACVCCAYDGLHVRVPLGARSYAQINRHLGTYTAHLCATLHKGNPLLHQLA